MQSHRRLIETIEGFVHAFPASAAFPCGEEIAIPMESEVRLVEAIEDSALPSQDVASDIRTRLSKEDGYALVIFAARMAVLSARTDDKRWIAAGVVGLVLDDTVDWRDILRAMSVVDNCAMRVGFDLRQALDALSHAVTDIRRGTIYHDYFSRPQHLRSIAHMGIVVTGAGSTIDFRST